MDSFYFRETPLGKMGVRENGTAVTHVTVDQLDTAGAQESETPLIAETFRQLGEYFQGIRREFDVPLAPQGTEFQKKAWKVLAEIPYGTVISYGEETRRMGCGCARAAGSANGKNPILILIPCHRVTAADGGLGGFSAGLWRKEWLLAHEQAHREEII